MALIAYRTASRTLAEVERTESRGNVITVILRAGKPIPKGVLRQAEKYAHAVLNGSPAGKTRQ